MSELLSLRCKQKLGGFPKDRNSTTKKGLIREFHKKCLKWSRKDKVERTKSLIQTLTSFVITFLWIVLLFTRTWLFLKYNGLHPLHYWIMCLVFHLVFCCKSSCYIFFAGYSFVTRVFSRKSKTYKLNDINYLVHC